MVVSKFWLLWIVLQWMSADVFTRCWFFSLSGTYPEEGLLVHMVILSLTFWGFFLPFSILASPVYIHTSSVQSFPFIHSRQHVHYGLPCLCNSPPWQMWTDISLWVWFFDLHFLMISDVKHLLRMNPLAICIVSLEK